MYNMENLIDQLTQSMCALMGEVFINMWQEYKNQSAIEAQRDIPGFAPLKVLLTYCLNNMQEKTKYEKCNITSFIYSVLYINETFLWRYERLRETSLNKIDELLQDDFVLSGAHPMVVSVLERFKDKYQIDVVMNED